MGHCIKNTLTFLTDLQEADQISHITKQSLTQVFIQFNSLLGIAYNGFSSIRFKF